MGLFSSTEAEYTLSMRVSERRKSIHFDQIVEIVEIVERSTDPDSNGHNISDK